MTPTEFLTARLDEEEVVARAALTPERWWVDGPASQTGMWWVYDTGAKFESREIATHVARHDPARVLADIAAKRAIVALHAPVEDHNWKSGESHGYLWCGMCGSLDDSPEPYPCRTSLALLQPFADREDFDPAWRK